MCAACRAEYEDPADRRFHAQPNACPVCGPHVWLERSRRLDTKLGKRGAETGELSDAIGEARRLLASGSIIAIKGLGGFHLACDATRDEPVRELRRRKGRVAKPFALMATDAESVARHCRLSDAERELLESPARPIVLLRRLRGSTVSHHVAPGVDELGFMLPYTPLHMLLLEPEDGYPSALVMTSGNFAEEPIVTDNEEARDKLSVLSDWLLLHDRPIHARCDDSVVRVFRGTELPIRRSRGYAPYPVHLPFDVPPLLAAGGELKNAFCLARDGYAFLSQHIGDMENYETLTSFEAMVDHFKGLFRIQPELVGYDLHPDYLASRYALSPATAGLERVGVQHHHAHIAACMAENRLEPESEVIGLSFDGTGFGTDRAIWGGEVLIAKYSRFERAGHLRPVKLPGAEAAIRKPYRMALAWLAEAGIDWAEDLPPVAAASEVERRTIRAQLGGRLPSPTTTSMGRLFDAVAALAGVRLEVTYEAQAAIELEAAIDSSATGSYSFGIDQHEAGLVIDPAPAIRELVLDLRSGVPTGTIAARFHRAVAKSALDVCRTLRSTEGHAAVCLSGGVFQNVSLLDLTVSRLETDGFTVYWHREVPPNDGGLALGQAVVAAAVHSSRVEHGAEARSP